MGNQHLALAGNLVPPGTPGTERLRWHLRSFFCHSRASAILGAAREPWQSAEAVCPSAGSLVGGRQGSVPWAGSSSWVAFGLVEKRGPLGIPSTPAVSYRGLCVHASHRDPRCLCPTRDYVCAHPMGHHACLHPSGTPGVCIPWGSVGTLGRACQVVQAGAAPRPRGRAVSPGERAQVTCGRGGVRLVRRTCLLSTERRRLPRLLVQCNVCTHTCRKQSTRGQVGL